MPFMDRGLLASSVDSEPDSDPMSLVKNVLEMASVTSLVAEENSVIGRGHSPSQASSHSIQSGVGSQMGAE